MFPSVQIPVVATPDGRADAVARMPGTGEKVFALPAEGRMTMEALMAHLEVAGRKGSGEAGNRLYMQHQNDCMRQCFPALQVNAYLNSYGPGLSHGCGFSSISGGFALATGIKNSPKQPMAEEQHSW
jgi:hypothetical protein